VTFAHFRTSNILNIKNKLFNCNIPFKGTVWPSCRWIPAIN